MEQDVWFITCVLSMVVLVLPVRNGLEEEEEDEEAQTLQRYYYELLLLL